MTDKPTPKEPKNVSCEVCLKEIPDSVAKSSEGDEYTQHFCGIECYENWHKESVSPSDSANEGTNNS